MLWPLLIAAAFLAGSIPFGLIIGRARGIDIRQHGSKNIGATNVGRVLGKKAGFLCFGLDVAKGLIPAVVAGAASGLLHPSLVDRPIEPPHAWLWLAILVAAVLGHMFSPWVGFKGGKGVATGLGAALGICPYLTIPGLAAFAAWLIAVKLSRYVSLASIVAAIAFPLLVYAWAALSTALSPEAAHPATLYPFYAVAALLGILVVIRHRGNIRRLLAGTENAIGTRKPGIP
jgi:glycerol-3-phosphate acyltransferase PlsY